jgi:hypothetical protein
VLTADTYTSVLPDVARHTAEDIAAEILTAARIPPGAHRPGLPGLTLAPPNERRAIQQRPNRRSGRVGRPGLEPGTYGLCSGRCFHESFHACVDQKTGRLLSVVGTARQCRLVL